jgi:hypothetical protein
VSKWHPDRLAAKRAKYLERKLSNRCIECASTLQEDDGLRCVECSESARRAKLKYIRQPRVRQAKTISRNKLVEAGKCTRCAAPRGRTMLCDSCAAIHAEYNRKSYERRRDGIVQAKAHEPAKFDDRSYRPLDELLGSIRNQLLRTMARFDWETSDVLLLALNVPEDLPTRNRYQTCMGYLVKTGLVERNRSHYPYEYRITEAGRSVLASSLSDYERRLEARAA